MLCPTCGTTNIETANFCKSCGTGLSVRDAGSQAARTSRPVYHNATVASAANEAYDIFSMRNGIIEAKGEIKTSIATIIASLLLGAFIVCMCHPDPTEAGACYVIGFGMTGVWKFMKRHGWFISYSLNGVLIFIIAVISTSFAVGIPHACLLAFRILRDVIRIPRLKSELNYRTGAVA